LLLIVLSAARNVHLHSQTKVKIVKQTVDAFITIIASVGAICVDLSGVQLHVASQQAHATTCSTAARSKMNMSSACSAQHYREALFHPCIQ